MSLAFKESGCVWGFRPPAPSPWVFLLLGLDRDQAGRSASTVTAGEELTPWGPRRAGFFLELLARAAPLSLPSAAVLISSISCEELLPVSA